MHIQHNARLYVHEQVKYFPIEMLAKDVGIKIFLMRNLM